MHDFFIRALIAGAGVAVVAGPLGCVIVWRRLAYFGDTLAHAALLGAALALLAGVNITFAVFGVSALIALALLFLQRRAALSSDSLLGLMSHSALALGILALTFIASGAAGGGGAPFNLTGLLFGDILAVSETDILIIYGGGLSVLAVLARIWRPLFAATVSPELAEAEGMRPDRANIVFMLLLAAVIAIAMKIAGVLLITALLIIPAAAARRFSSTPERMAVTAAVIGAASAAAGLFASLRWDTPSGPGIVAAALVFFILSLSPLAAAGRGWGRGWGRGRGRERARGRPDTGGAQDGA